MFHKQNFRNTIFSPCRWNFSSLLLYPSPLPPIPDARMPQFVLPCTKYFVFTIKWDLWNNTVLKVVSSKGKFF